MRSISCWAALASEALCSRAMVAGVTAGTAATASLRRLRGAAGTAGTGPAGGEWGKALATKVSLGKLSTICKRQFDGLFRACLDWLQLLARFSTRTVARSWR
jgi:hypothetical protein